LRDSREIEIDLLQLFYVLWKNIILIVAVTVVFADLGFAYSTFLMTPIYSASAELVVNNKSANSENRENVSSADLTASSNLVETYSVILKSHTLLGTVIDDLGLEDTYEQLSRNITVADVNDTPVMRITVRDPDPDQAMRIVAKIVDIAPGVIIDKVEAGSVKVVDEPYTTRKPVSPNVQKYTLAAAMLGFILVCGLLILQELLNNTFKSEQDITRILDLPVLAVVPLEGDHGASAKAAGKKG
jgi:capsular polysaccharide biosynthesis protein